jgi:hypothetical protein
LEGDGESSELDEYEIEGQEWGERQKRDRFEDCANWGRLEQECSEWKASAYDGE